jgi:hypothetical protein
MEGQIQDKDDADQDPDIYLMRMRIQIRAPKMMRIIRIRNTAQQGLPDHSTFRPIQSNLVRRYL